MEKLITSFDELQTLSHTLSGWIFRGQEDCSWNLETSIERCFRRIGSGIDRRKYESDCLQEFQRHAKSHLKNVSPPQAKETLEWLSLMQHYGAPTRLLDFTNSFLIALFFAYENAIGNCAVWAIQKNTLGNIDTLRRTFPNESKLDFNKALKKHINSGNFETEFVYHHVPFYTNPRLEIQQGTFLFTLNSSKSISELISQNQKEVRKFVISNQLYPQIRKHLNSCNCNARGLFADIGGFARYFNNHTFVENEGGS